MAKKSEFQLSPPIFFEGSNRDLRIESTLGELPLFQFQVEISKPCDRIVRIFEKYPLLPGVILLENGEFMGMVSRQRLLEYLIRPRAMELFLNAPIQMLYSYARTEILLLPDHTPIVQAARQALRRSPELLGEPIVVQKSPDDYQLLNIHELNIAYWQIRGIETQLRFEQIQSQMIQHEKMASLGRLVDGVAHEILDPVGFIWGNLTYVSDYASALMELVDAYEKLVPNPPEHIEEIQQEIELDFVKQDLPQTLDSIKNGSERLKKLATSLQNFCHIDDVYPKPADLHACIDSVLLLLKSRLGSEIEVVTHYGNLPPILCYASQLNQVFMNILSQCIDGLIDRAVNQKLAGEFRDAGLRPAPPNLPPKSRIEIATQLVSKSAIAPGAPDSRWVSIKIAHNGTALSPQKYEEILTSFSTERRGEKETSLGVSYWIVTARHGGEFYLRSQTTHPEELPPDIGTEFEMLLPLT
ncbi:sensor histidine kinase [Phormidium sp. CCY1219]|uniref:sensor histidine kinase n=1 Tax=Phormidium sp. CCY1219 TaxID=2886104 RepID=UPI002D1F2C61|nr:sensor histidine kinase [Phormidium sp. CCY1219]MEB3829408.1 sensor histidine kinase [Phormidium sp. CCY1219]